MEGGLDKDQRHNGGQLNRIMLKSTGGFDIVNLQMHKNSRGTAETGP